MPKTIFKLLLDTCLPVGAFVVSIISLCIAYKSQQATKRLDAAERKTALLIKILEARDKLFEASRKMEEITQFCGNCSKSALDAIYKDMQLAIEELDKMFADLSHHDVSDPIKVEKTIPHAIHMITTGARVVQRAEDVLTACKECKDKIPSKPKETEKKEP